MTHINGVNNPNLTPMQRFMQSQKTDKAQGALPLVPTNAVKSDEIYGGIGLKFSPEARMAAEMEKSPFMQSLNELFAIS